MPFPCVAYLGRYTRRYDVSQGINSPLTVGLICIAAVISLSVLFLKFSRRRPRSPVKHEPKISSSDLNTSISSSASRKPFSSGDVGQPPGGGAGGAANVGEFSKSVGAESAYHNAKKSGFHTAHVRLPETKVTRSTASGKGLEQYAKGCPSESGLQDLQTKAKEAIMIRKEAKKRTLDELILQEVHNTHHTLTIHSPYTHHTLTIHSPYTHRTLAIHSGGDRARQALRRYQL
jgi:hypothetical protein